MKKEIKNYLPFYYGITFYHVDDQFNRTPQILNGYFIDRWNENCELPLRPLQYIQHPEIEHLLFLVMDSEAHLDKQSRITKDEVAGCIDSTENDDGAIVVNFSLRCFVGTLYISEHSGNLRLFNEEEDELPIEFKPEIFQYLLSCGFDIFSLIKEKLAADTTEIII